MLDKEVIIKRALKHNATDGRTLKALRKILDADYPAGTNLVVEFVKEFMGLPYGDDGLRLDKKADCSSFWGSVFYVWFGIDIGSYTESQWANKNARRIPFENAPVLSLIYYDFKKPGRTVTHVAGKISETRIAHTRSKLRPFMADKLSYAAGDIVGVADFLTENMRKSVTVEETGSGGGQPMAKPAEPVFPVYRYCGATYTNLRKGPGVKYADIGDIRSGETVAKYEEKGGWWRVKHEPSGLEGWTANVRLFRKV